MTRAKNQENAGRNANTILATGDEGPDPGYVIYVYNILDRPYVVEQPPTFPHFNIPACPKGDKFSVTMLPAFTLLPFEKEGDNEGTTEIYYKREDGRKAATSLLNPSAFPGTKWD